MENTWIYPPEAPIDVRDVLIAIVGAAHPIMGYSLRHEGGSVTWCDSATERELPNQEGVIAWMELPPVPPLCAGPEFTVYGKTQNNGHITVEHQATNEGEAIEYAKELRPDCTFTLAVPKK
jgi:hypothetical protein